MNVFLFFGAAAAAPKKLSSKCSAAAKTHL